MSISLQKRAENVGISLKKKGINVAPIMRVGLAVDCSGSMSHLYKSGAVQNAFEQIQGVALTFDDNGELDNFAFENHCTYVGTSTSENYEGYVNRNFGPRGGTNYSPIIIEVEKFFFKGETVETKKVGGFFGIGAKTVKNVIPANNMPVLMIVLTDGEPGDLAETRRELQKHADANIYWHFVGIGGTRHSFPSIAKLADEFDNVGEVYLPRLDMTDSEIYDQLICDELVEWIKTHPVAETA